MEGWLLEVLGCATAGCGGKLRTEDGELIGRDGVVHCKRCEVDYPVLGGVAVLLPGPEEWVASYREAIVSSLAEHRRLTRGGLALIDRFAGAARSVQAMRFGDDWVKEESGERTVEPFVASDDSKLFAHGPRHFEVYFVRAIVAEHA